MPWGVTSLFCAEERQERFGGMTGYSLGREGQETLESVSWHCASELAELRWQTL